MTAKVAILMGSPNDADRMQRAGEYLTRFGIEHETREDLTVKIERC